MSADTPRTDAVDNRSLDFAPYASAVEFRSLARTLERELAANAAELVRVRAERDGAHMDPQRLWQALKNECCSNPETAYRIVLLNEEQLKKSWEAALRAAVPGTG